MKINKREKNTDEQKRKEYKVVHVVAPVEMQCSRCQVRTARHGLRNASGLCPKPSVDGQARLAQCE